MAPPLQITLSNEVKLFPEAQLLTTSQYAGQFPVPLVLRRLKLALTLLEDVQGLWCRQNEEAQHCGDIIPHELRPDARSNVLLFVESNAMPGAAGILLQHPDRSLVDVAEVLPPLQAW